MEIESSDPYWYLLPNDIKNLNKLDVKNVKFLCRSNDNWSEYKKSISNIHSNSCFQEALVVGYEEYRLKSDSIAKVIDTYRECIVQMPLEIKNLLIVRPIKNLLGSEKELNLAKKRQNKLKLAFFGSFLDRKS